MNFSFQLQRLLPGWVAACLLLASLPAHAFSLLGPPAPWMLSSNNVIEPGDIGGPMDLGSGYRWNVPVVTYGFDQSFLDYFGSNGVAAVEAAIQILNNLPPASQMNLADYPFDSQHINYKVENLWLGDLKSKTLSLLLEQLGLADATRYTHVIKQWSPGLSSLGTGITGEATDWAYPDYIDLLSFDPETFNPTPYVNEVLYSATAYTFGNQNYVNSSPVDPTAAAFSALTSSAFTPGAFDSGLTYDDAGGLRYLYSTNTICFETLLPGITGAGTNAAAWLNGAWRPGIDKITFVRHPTDPASGAFLSVTNFYTDAYLTNGYLTNNYVTYVYLTNTDVYFDLLATNYYVTNTSLANGNLVQQQLQRVISRPDFLFTVTDLFDGTFDSSSLTFGRSSTSNWINNASLNRQQSGEGPGIIAPPVQISFGKNGRQIESSGSLDQTAGEYSVINNASYFGSPFLFGSCVATTNPPVVYPVSRTGTNQMITRMWLTLGSSAQKIQQCFTWSPTTNFGGVFQCQTTTNLSDWVPLFLVTNDGSIATYYVYQPASPKRYYRLLPQ